MLLLSRVTGNMGVYFNCPSEATSVASYIKEMGWSSDRSVPRLLLLPGGRGLVVLPSAMVPSWQERHKMDDPSGCLEGSTGIFEVELVVWSYMIYLVPVLPLFHAGETGLTEWGV